jgi:hypothetical protein
VTSIEQAAFQGCTSLASVSIPSSVTSIGVNAFGGCTSLNSVVFQAGGGSADSGATLRMDPWGCSTPVPPSSTW